MTTIRRSFGVTLALVAVTACDSTEPDLSPTLTLAAPQTAIAGQALTFEASASDDQGLARLDIVWGDGGAETIDLSGTSASTTLEHTYGTLGTFQVQATVHDDGGQTAAASGSIEVGPASVVIDQAGGDTINALGYTATLTARAFDAAGAELDGFEPGWQALDPATATVAAGVVTAVAPGEGRIRAAGGGAADTVVVLVRQVPSSVVVTAPDTLGVREGVLLAAVVSDSNDVVIPGAEVTWSSTAPAVAAVDAAGELTGEAEGTTVVVASAGPATDSATVEVSLMLLFGAPPPGSEYFDVFTMSRFGTARRQLTTYEFTDMDPVWSPDRRSIAFWSSRNTTGVIMLMNDDGSDERSLDTGLQTASDFAWSPDGTRIAFAGRTEGDTDDIYVIDVDGSGLTRLTTDAADEDSPAWSPDGARIAFVRIVDGSPDILAMDDDGANVVNLTASATAQDVAPVWSPDGTEIAFASTLPDIGAIVIHRMNADGTNIRQIGDHSVLQLDWSPDGSMFVFATDAVDGQQDIFILPVDGGALTRVTDDAVWEQDVRWR